MDLLLLPGNGKENKGWIDLVEDSFRSLFNSTTVQYYDHWWESGEEREIDLEEELEKVAGLSESLGKYLLFGREEGALLGLYGVFLGVLEPEVCMFVNLDLEKAKEMGLDINSWLTNYEVPTLFLQRGEARYQEFEAYLQDRNVGNFSLVKLPESGSEGEEIEWLRESLERFVDL